MSPESSHRRRVGRDTSFRLALAFLLLTALVGSLLLLLEEKQEVTFGEMPTAAASDTTSDATSMSPPIVAPQQTPASTPAPVPAVARRPSATPIPLEPIPSREPLVPGVVTRPAPTPLEESPGSEPLVPAVVVRPAPTPLEENPNGTQPLIAPVLDLRALTNP